MTSRCPAEIGDPVSEIDTPALIIELDAFERNLDRMADLARTSNIRLRPHAKTHKSPTIAHMQIARGAVGVCCQKVGEAEVMVANGVKDVLVSNQIVGARKLRRLAALAKQAHIGVCVDNVENVADISAAAQDAGVEIDVLIEVCVMRSRCGVLPGEPTVELAKAISAADGLRFAGLHAYHGRAQHYRSHEERKDAIAEASREVNETIDLLRKAGIATEIVTGAGTGTVEFEAGSGVYNELQAGSYIFMDVDYAKNLDDKGNPVSSYEHSLFVLATVMSVPTEDRAVCDAGLKALSVDSGLPIMNDDEKAEYVGASDEHGTLRVKSAANPLRLGEKVKLVPGHCDPTVNLYDWYVGVRNGRVEALWPVAARGAVL